MRVLLKSLGEVLEDSRVVNWGRDEDDDIFINYGQFPYYLVRADEGYFDGKTWVNVRETIGSIALCRKGDDDVIEVHENWVKDWRR